MNPTQGSSLLSPPTKLDDPQQVKNWLIDTALEHGFSAAGVAKLEVGGELERLKAYLAKGHAGQMSFLNQHHELRGNPKHLVEGALCALCVRMDYLETAPGRINFEAELGSSSQGVVARYAQGRDYHKLMRAKLKKLALALQQHLGREFVYRPFCDSAPVFEKRLAENAGLGWTGKHTLLIHPSAGSFFVLGELFLGLDLPECQPVAPSCGSCSACLQICPTKALVAPYQLDASKCIAYLTIEHRGSIDPELRPLIGNRVFGCDDCQLICPWNRFAKAAKVSDFLPRNTLDNQSLLKLWQLSEAEFLNLSQGSPIRRAGYEGFLRNVAVAMGNAAYQPSFVQALTDHPHGSELIQEHARWALERQLSKQRDNSKQSD